MTTILSIPLNIFFFNQIQTTPTSSNFQHPQTVTFSRRKTTLKTACSGSQQNPQQHQKQQKKKKKEFNTNDTDSDGEKGYDPVAFLVKRGISHKAFAQFLRER
jgi:1,4-alpha-glucan branching enzyme